MGLTVHYKLRAGRVRSTVARQLIVRLRKKALAQSFADVGPLTIIGGRNASPVISAGIEFALLDDCTRAYAFDLLPARGCETATFGLAWKRSAWSWYDFCKTQYASNPRCGGVENFIRGHTELIHLLDDARALGLKIELHDEGKYHELRDVDALRAEVESWNGMVAAGAGMLKDSTAVGEITGPIIQYPNFEPLEAKGVSFLRKS